MLCRELKCCCCGAAEEVEVLMWYCSDVEKLYTFVWCCGCCEREGGVSVDVGDVVQ